MLQALVQPKKSKNKKPTQGSSRPLRLAPVQVGPYKMVALPKGAVQITYCHGSENRSLSISQSGTHLERVPQSQPDLADLEALFSVLRAENIPERNRHSVYAYLKYQASALAPESLAQWCMFVANDEGQMNIEDLKQCAQSLGRYDTNAQAWLLQLIESFYTINSQ